VVTEESGAIAAVPTPSTDCEPPPAKRWKFLSAKQSAVRPPTNDTAQSEMNKYMIELRNSPPASDALQFWEQRMPVYPRLAPLAQDLISAPASQAFVERIFSVCGLLTEGRRNRTTKSLEMCVFLRLNAHIILGQ